MCRLFGDVDPSKRYFENSLCLSTRLRNHYSELCSSTSLSSSLRNPHTSLGSSWQHHLRQHHHPFWISSAEAAAESIYLQVERQRRQSLRAADGVLVADLEARQLRQLLFWISSAEAAAEAIYIEAQRQRRQSLRTLWAKRGFVAMEARELRQCRQKTPIPVADLEANELRQCRQETPPHQPHQQSSAAQLACNNLFPSLPLRPPPINFPAWRR